ncbi:uncharacterized protein BO88DRAFT_404163 [Aspergillus vadensis CBS 113365]|uniref:Uncharacterized protein n=1 Tax=Aspergillus vadensis (strain CBS 113365 / IMI 142717 / IBT 24658) TaxID=1448311 RepID=A0A319BA48_ASPVC|nr:hypothetical protein BO88DRAFT_404163 [Aspergillus vadensis CBS 113365]PYH69806.1 hypothetical protein BO88DRAFT_404163 [Aspergillus vadensis CBS 113365]
MAGQFVPRRSKENIDSQLRSLLKVTLIIISLLWLPWYFISPLLPHPSTGFSGYPLPRRQTLSILRLFLFLFPIYRVSHLSLE